MLGNLTCGYTYHVPEDGPSALEWTGPFSCPHCPKHAGISRRFRTAFDGQADAVNQRITDAPGTIESEPGPGSEGDVGSEPTA
jgi:hypothetical protein